MVHNIELLANPSIAPVYVTATNMIYSIAVITFKSVYEFAIKFMEKALEIAFIALHTLHFIVQQLISDFNKLNKIEQILMLFCFYNLFTSLMSSFSFHDKIKKQEKETVIFYIFGVF